MVYNTNMQKLRSNVVSDTPENDKVKEFESNSTKLKRVI